MSDWHWEGWATAEDGLTPVPIPVVALPDGMQMWTVICSGKDTHQPDRIGYLADRRATSFGDVIAFNLGHSSHTPETRHRRRRVRVEALNGVPHDYPATPTIRAKCTACRLDYQRRQEAVGPLLDRLEASGLTPGRVVDISYLP